MPSRAWQVLPLVAAVILPTDAAAQDGPECFSRYTKFNVCEKARDLQRSIAPTLPMRTSANGSIVSVSAIGPELTMNGVWDLRKADLENALSASGQTIKALDASMQAATKNSVCSSEVTAAFVRLGGRIRYTYRTQDLFFIANIVVSDCSG
jgi:hypothetical protein